MSTPKRSPRFLTMYWSVVRQATGPDEVEARRALATFCEAYWYPLYAYIRSCGHLPADAEDLTQGFFARLLARETLGRADPARGKLRTFLLACVRHFLADEAGRARAQKRGGGLVGFDPAEAEVRYAAEPADTLTPDRLYQRRWALTLLDDTLADLGEEFAAQGRADLFAALRPFLGFGPEPEKCYEETAAALEMPMGTLKNHVFRLRQRWRERLFDRVAATLDEPTPESIRDELTELLGAV